MFKRVYKKPEPQKVVYDGTVVGRYFDAQSRMLVEVSFNVNGKEQVIRKQEYLLGFETEIGQKVKVEFDVSARGTFISVKK